MGARLMSFGFYFGPPLGFEGLEVQLCLQGPDTSRLNRNENVEEKKKISQVGIGMKDR